MNLWCVCVCVLGVTRAHSFAHTQNDRISTSTIAMSDVQPIGQRPLRAINIYFIRICNTIDDRWTEQRGKPKRTKKKEWKKNRKKRDRWNRPNALDAMTFSNDRSFIGSINRVWKKIFFFFIAIDDVLLAHLFNILMRHNCWMVSCFEPLCLAQVRFGRFGRRIDIPPLHCISYSMGDPMHNTDWRRQSHRRTIYYAVIDLFIVVVLFSLWCLMTTFTDCVCWLSCANPPVAAVSSFVDDANWIRNEKKGGKTTRNIIDIQTEF